jgi:predicted ArsR family transcriptional regulator
MAGNKNSGRLEFKPTDDQRTTVRVLKAGGMTNEAVAEVIGISEPTLRKHFASEIDLATAKVRAEMLMARYNAAKGGNVQAQNKMLELVGAASADAKIKDRERRTPALGKKEQQQAAAENVGGKFAPPAGPRLAVNNTK